MNLSEKIIKLRRAQGLSQEELAERLGVSRQAVSKWESNQSLPDIDKIISLSEFFGVSTDYLLKQSEPSDIFTPDKDVYEEKEDTDETDDDILGEESENAHRANSLIISRDELSAHFKINSRVAKITASAVLLFILSPILIILLPGLSELGLLPIKEGAAVLIGILAIFFFVSLGVGLCIYADFISKESPIPKNADYKLDDAAVEFLKKEKQSKAKSGIFSLIIGTSLCILSPVPLLISALAFDGEKIQELLVLFSIAILLAVVAVAVFFLSKFGITDSGRNEIYESRIAKKKRNDNKALSILNDCYWSLIVFLYLLISFMTKRWDITWIIWPLSPIIPNLFTVFYSLRKKK